MCPSAGPRVPGGSLAAWFGDPRCHMPGTQPHSRGGQLACHVSACSGGCRLRARTERGRHAAQAYTVADPCRPRPQYSQAQQESPPRPARNSRSSSTVATLHHSGSARGIIRQVETHREGVV
jgi:hypothetical protein